MSIHEHLQKIGFSAYEGKVYAALVAHPGITGYEVSKHSGVPRAKVYEVLENLVRGGSVLTTMEEDQQLYRPLPPDILLSRFRQEMEETLDGLRDDLQALHRRQQEPELITLRGYEHIMNRAREMCRDAKRGLLVSGFYDELEGVAGEIRDADADGRQVYVLQFGDEDLGIDNQFFHSISPMQHVQVEHYGRWFAVIRDTEEALLAQVRGEDTTALWTNHMGVILAVAMWIQHDISLHVIIDEADPQMVEDISRKINARLAGLSQLNLPE